MDLEHLSYMEQKHIPVMLNETIDQLVIKKDGIYIDGTAGYGGHSTKILQQLTQGMLYSFDVDPEAYQALRNLFSQQKNIEIIHASYVDAVKILSDKNILSVDGVLLDLGLSSPQLDSLERGFSFKDNLSLNMRFDKDENALTASKVINTFSEEEIANILFQFGDEKKSRKIARAIVETRKKQRIQSTSQLASIICQSLGMRVDKESGLPTRYIKTHPATRSLQALRIFVNDEYKKIEEAVRAFSKILKEEGRLVIISFHSGEDRIIKHLFKSLVENDSDLEIVTKKPIECSREEARNNPRARSSKIRVIKKKSHARKNSISS